MRCWVCRAAPPSDTSSVCQCCASIAPLRQDVEGTVRMRVMLLFVITVSVLGLNMAARADAATVPMFSPQAPATHTQQGVDQHDDSRVDVQLVVAGITAVVVVGLGSAAYVLRRKLGLTAYDPKEASGGHH